MDNLTHALVGATLGQMGLKKKTGLAVITLVLAANLPDLDVFATLAGEYQHLALRRGVLHGPLGILILPPLLWALMIAFDRWQTKRGTRPASRPPVHKSWLLALAYIGCISHSLLDLLNVYGIRILEPFSDRWFYVDTLFIIDIWIWIALIIGLWWSFRREKKGVGDWQRPAWISFTVVSAYIIMNGAITGMMETRTVQWLKYNAYVEPVEVVASPIPIEFWKREILWRSEDRYGSYYANIFTSSVDHYQQEGEVESKPIGLTEKQIAELREASPEANAFLFWSRMPIAEQRADKLVIQDQRFMDPRVGDRFTLKVPVPADGLGEVQ